MPKPDKSYRKRTIGEHRLSPESLVIGYGYDPQMSEGSIKPPVFMTSTFAFKSAAMARPCSERLPASSKPEIPKKPT